MNGHLLLDGESYDMPPIGRTSFWPANVQGGHAVSAGFDFASDLKGL
jgi:hypothetical protein